MNKILTLKQSRKPIFAFNPSIQEAEPGWPLWAQGQLGLLYSEFQEIQGYLDRPCLKNAKNQNQHQKRKYISKFEPWIIWQMDSYFIRQVR